MKHIAVLAVSGRMLAQTCVELGYTVHVLDCFNDIDTCEVAKSTYRVSFSNTGFNQHEVNTALDSILKKVELIGVLIGSGVETSPDVIDSINLKTKVIGHSSKVFKRAHNAKSFFSVLDKLNIPYPKTLFTPPTDKKNIWLCKRSGSLGGQHITNYKGKADKDKRVYFQALEQGQAMSALFFAEKQNSSLLGLHRLILHEQFQYAGAVYLPDSEFIDLRKILLQYFQSLQNEFGLQGLCGIDFIFSTKEEIKVLELNARPTATLGLHEGKRDYLPAHLQSFYEGTATLQKKAQSNCLGEAIVFAEQNCKSPKNLAEFTYVSDISTQNTEFKQGEPICTVFASTSNTAETEKLLYDRHRFIKSQLEII